MTAFDILNHWAEYTKYDPEQKSFNMLSATYKANRCCKQIEKISSFDPTGAFSVMYAKKCFLEICNEFQIKLIDFMQNRNALKEECEMWDIFHSEDELRVEQNILDAIDHLVQQATNKKMLGSRDLEKEKEVLLDSVDSVVDDLTKCRVELFLRGTAPIGTISRCSTSIHVFERLADCLLALEQAEDGIYLCYISNHGTSDGYFSFFIKSNGNILSINERQDEAYPGQHKNTRNGRWQDNKGLKLFPYNYIFSFSDHDYKGYASKYMIDMEQLDFFNLQPMVYIPLIIAMVMLVYKYSGVSLEDMKLSYSDALLSMNVSKSLPGMEALAIPETSVIAVKHRGLSVSLTSENVIDSSFGAQYDWNESQKSGKERGEIGYFPGKTESDIFIELYGGGFELDTSSLLEANQHMKALPADRLTHVAPNAEFVGSEDRFAMIAYMQGREQLTEYIRDNMFSEYQRFGGRDTVIQWYKETLAESRDRIMDLLKQKVSLVKAGEEENVFCSNLLDASNNPLAFISYGEETEHTRVPMDTHPLNKAEIRHGRDVLFCPVTGAVSSIFFHIRPRNWKDLALLVGENEIPKIVKGWKKSGHSVVGNPILNATDAITGIGTPFELDEININKRYWTSDRWRDYYFHHLEEYPDWTKREPEMEPIKVSPWYNFVFVVGFSKRGFKKFFEK